MIFNDKALKKHTNNKFLIIDALIDIIVKKDILVSNTSYYYHNDELQEFLVSLYALKLLINDEEYFEKKQSEYIELVKNRLSDNSNINSLDISKISNIEAETELELVTKLKELFVNNKYLYVKSERRVVFDNDMYVDSKWLISYLTLLFDNASSSEGKKRYKCMLYNT